MLRYINYLIFILICTLLFAACGGGGSGSASGVLTGKFVDAPVEGMTYRSGSITGKTDAYGNFRYESGKTVTFEIGDVVIGTSQGDATVTPLDLARHAKNDPNLAANDQLVLNIIRFLMTITGSNVDALSFSIVQATYDNCVGQSVDFDVPTNTFTIPGAITANSTASVADAATHFQNTLEALTPTGDYFIAQWILETDQIPKAESLVLTIESDSYAKVGGSQIFYARNANNDIMLSTDHGRMSSDSSYLITVDTTLEEVQGEELATRIGIKKSTGKSNALLSSDYHVIGLTYNDNYIAYTQAFNFDGAGALTVGGQAYDYAIAADGALTVSSALKTLSGQASHDGNVFVLLDNTYETILDDNQNQIMIGIKKSTSADDTIFNGQYGFSTINYYNGPDKNSGFYLSTSTGEGIATSDTLYHSADPPSRFTNSYTVLNDGSFVFGDMSGAISGDGGFLAIMENDQISPDGRQGLLIGVK